jgi:hypothetical protein
MSAPSMLIGLLTQPGRPLSLEHLLSFSSLGRALVGSIGANGSYCTIGINVRALCSLENCLRSCLDCRIVVYDPVVLLFASFMDFNVLTWEWGR